MSSSSLTYNAKVTISRRTDQYSNDVMCLSVKDGKSSLPVCEVEIGMAEMMSALSGLSFVDGEFTFRPTKYGVKRYGKKRITDRVRIPKICDKDDMRRAVNDDFNSRFSYEWELFSDGTSSRQDGKYHEYVIMKFEDSDD